jgi:glucose-6-phosphate isomerase
VETLERAGHPVARISVKDIWHIGQEFFRWEIATAVAGAIIGIDPFDQPDVEASKDKTRALTEEYEKSHQPAGRRSRCFARMAWRSMPIHVTPPSSAGTIRYPAI